MFAEHGCKNFKKRLEKLGQIHPEIKQIASRCAIALRSCLKQCQGQKWVFLKLVQLRVNHYCGDHSKCPKWRNGRACDTTLGITNMEAKEKFIVS